jgi:hemolysin III
MYHGERFNSWTHALGLALSVLGAAALMQEALKHGHWRHVVGFGAFGLTMVVLYGASTLYHSTQGARKALWAKADHCAIYLLIAGTYTPFALLTLHGPLGWGLLAFVWVLAAIGVCKELWWGRDTVPSVPLYVLMGWCGIVASKPLVEGLHQQGWIWLLAGGLLYSVGIAFYALSDRVKHAHGVWHLFVLGGTASHFVTVMNFVA